MDATPAELEALARDYRDEQRQTDRRLASLMAWVGNCLCSRRPPFTAEDFLPGGDGEEGEGISEEERAERELRKFDALFLGLKQEGTERRENGGEADDASKQPVGY